MAVISAMFAGGALNMLIIMVSSYIIPPPEGADITTMEGLEAAMPMMKAQHFLMPFLAHALGTLLGAWVVTKLAVSRQFIFAMAIGVWFLIGGIANIVMLPSPIWFAIVDLVLAYIPMAYLGYMLAVKHKRA